MPTILSDGDLVIEEVEVGEPTPGPWTFAIAELHGGFCEASIVDAAGVEIGYLYASDGLDEPSPLPTEANARLIASAPELKAKRDELLAAMQGVVEDRKSP